jgi:hypothetical protein
VALKLAVVFPEVTLTDPGTVSNALLLPSVTLDPPAGAAVFKVTTQLAIALAFRFPGLHARDEMAGTMIIPLVPARTGSPLPLASTPAGWLRVTAVVTALEASVS